MSFIHYSLLLLLATAVSAKLNQIIIDDSPTQVMLADEHRFAPNQLGAHWQPAIWFGPKNGSNINLTHVAVDESTDSLYLGATNWLIQLSGSTLSLNGALRSGPADSSGGCSPAALQPTGSQQPSSSSQQQQQSGEPCSLSQVAQPIFDLGSMPLQWAHFGLTTSGQATGRWSAGVSARPPQAAVTMHMQANYSQRARPPMQPLPVQTGSSGSTPAANNLNNYNKLLLVDPESRQLIVCGSLNQGACRRHQLGQAAYNFSELINLPVASDDEHSSTVGLVASMSSSQTQTGSRAHQSPVLYVAATNSRLNPNREMVPAISARHLDIGARAMQIIERSLDSARLDISYVMRDYYLVNYVNTFQHNGFVYFATIQRRSQLRELEEWGYQTRLARLCLNDLSFQSYVEITLECRRPATSSGASRKKLATEEPINYNILQDLHITQASSHLAKHFGLSGPSNGANNKAVLIGAFAQSKDHTWRPKQRSAICVYAMDQIESRFNENIQLCYNGTAKSRNMNYIAGSLNDCPKPTAMNKKTGTQSINYCNEPLKLNGSIAMAARPTIWFENELITSVQSTLAPTSPLNLAPPPTSQPDKHHFRFGSHSASSRQHQVIVAGTSGGALKRLVLVDGADELGGDYLRAVEFDRLQLHDEPILADLHLWPQKNPQTAQRATSTKLDQFALVASAHKLAKVRINGCKARSNNASNAFDTCQVCSQAHDPFCGWCTTQGACTTRDECLQAGSSAPVHWNPFDQIQCADYQPLSPRYVALQADTGSIDVNVRLPKADADHASVSGGPFGARLARAQFQCHFSYLSAPSSYLKRVSGATTVAMQARLNVHAATVAIGCPLPALNQRPVGHSESDHIRTRLTVRLAGAGDASAPLEHALGLAAAQDGANATTYDRAANQIEREFVMYDCTIHSSCRACLSAGSTGSQWSCSWCPMTRRCTFDASHAEFGCAASALKPLVGGATSGAAQSTTVASTAVSLAAQQHHSWLAVSIDRLAQCEPPEVAPSAAVASAATDEPQQQQPISGSDPTLPSRSMMMQTQTLLTNGEILVPSGSRRSIQVNLRQALGNQIGAGKRAQTLKLECLLEFEGAKARLQARLGPDVSAAAHQGGSQVVVCAESVLTYQTETAVLRAQLYVILNENQVIETSEVILYKCHLFGVSPPALFGASSVTSAALSSMRHGAFENRYNHSSNYDSSSSFASLQPNRKSGQSDCSLCDNIDKEFQCVWCANQCQHSDQCSQQPANTCPPPRIDSIQPNSGPIEGGTVLTIEGANLGSSEREIQDKVSIGGERCQLIMYSVSTRIVCKTPASLYRQQSSVTVSVSNKVGISSAHEKFHYKTVHLTDVQPRQGPISGGTRLYLSGSNLNIGSRLQVLLDELPCAIDSHDITSNQISCITAPNMRASSARIAKLTLIVDNSTHYLPYPFTYQPDPIITAIEPAESFVSGGRLVMIQGNYLSSPQTIQLLVYNEHEHKHNIINGTGCIKQNDTLVTCLTPAISPELIESLTMSSSMLANRYDDLLQAELNELALTGNSMLGGGQRRATSYEMGGLKLKMMLIMDDVISVRKLDEYYHHLPHYLTYFDDPKLFPLQSPVVEFAEELKINGENLRMKQLDQDMLITIGQSYACTIKSVLPEQIICEPPSKIMPVYDTSNQRLIERPLLPIVVLIGAHLRFQVGLMQYSSSQYLPTTTTTTNGAIADQFSQQQFINTQQIASNSIYGLQQNSLRNLMSTSLTAADPSMAQTTEQQTGNGSSTILAVVLVMLSVIGFLGGFLMTFMFAVSRFRQSKAEREYKRIQLQMGSLDINGQPQLHHQHHFGVGLFDKMPTFGHNNATSIRNGHITGINSHNNIGLLSSSSQYQQASVKSRAFDYVGNALLGKTKLFQHFNRSSNTQQQLPSFPPSPMTDVSSLVGSSPHTQQQHLVQLSSNGNGVINSAVATQYHNNHHLQQQQMQFHNNQPIYGAPSSSNDSSQSSPKSSSRNYNSFRQLQQQQKQLFYHQDRTSNDKNNDSVIHPPQLIDSNARNFNWTQDAPSTIVPYAVIEACNLPLDVNSSSGRKLNHL